MVGHPLLRCLPSMFFNVEVWRGRILPFRGAHLVTAVAVARVAGRRFLGVEAGRCGKAVVTRYAGGRLGSGGLSLFLFVHATHTTYHTYDVPL